MKYFIFLFVFSLLFSTCARVKIARLESSDVIDVSGDWNDVDSQSTANTMIKECLDSAWREDFAAKYGRKPIVIVGTVLNKSQEHINVQTITKDLEKEFVNSGRVKFVASKDERLELRDEKSDQSIFASSVTKKEMYQETGADFMLKGQINSIFDELNGKSVKYYQIELELIDIKTNDKVWVGQKKIKKLVQKGKYII